jgi:two-component system, OmpR family, phosphate regulon sensor histidine kinase PhoR
MRRSRFLWKLYAGYVFLILLATGIVGTLLAVRIENDTLTDIDRGLRAEAMLLRDIAATELAASRDAGQREPRLQRRVEALGQEIGTRLTIIRADGWVIAESDENPERMDNHGRRPEVLAAREHGIGTSSRYSDTVHRQMRYLALPVTVDGELLGYARASVPLTAISNRLDQVRNAVLVAAVAAIAVALLLGFFYARRVTKPVRVMARAAEAIAGGDYDHPVDVRSGDELGDLARALDTMKRQVLGDITKMRRLETVRRDFVGNVSHELKTPVTAIRGLVETLLDDPDVDPIRRVRFMTKIRNQAERLTSLVTDLLSLSRLESGGLNELEPIDVRRAVERSAHALRSTAEARRIAIVTESPPHPVMVEADEEILIQAVSNLLDNALKYTSGGGSVWVRVRTDDDHVVIEVQDTGIGIEDRHHNRIFERFYRIDKARSRELGGTGLGLAIVKHIALALGGEVSLDSSPGCGSTFRIRLPRTTSRAFDDEAYDLDPARFGYAEQHEEVA